MRDKSKFDDTEMMLEVAIDALVVNCMDKYHNSEECEGKNCKLCIREKLSVKADQLRKIRNNF